MQDYERKELSLMCRRNNAEDLVDFIQGFLERRGTGSTSYNRIDVLQAHVLEKTVAELKQLREVYDGEMNAAKEALAKRIAFK